jgi:hypothetical protein
VSLISGIGKCDEVKRIDEEASHAGRFGVP